MLLPKLKLLLAFAATLLPTLLAAASGCDSIEATGGRSPPDPVLEVVEAWSG